MPSEPQTESGRALLPQLNAWLPTTEVFGPNYNADRIVAIEKEAASKAVAEAVLEAEFWWARRWAAQYLSNGKGRVAAADMNRRANELGREHPALIASERER